MFVCLFSSATAGELQQWGMRDEEEPELIRETVTEEQILEYKQQKAAKAAQAGAKGASGGLGGFAAASAPAASGLQPPAAVGGPALPGAAPGGQVVGSKGTDSLLHAPVCGNETSKRAAITAAAGARGSVASYSLSQMEVEEQELLQLEYQMQAEQIKGRRLPEYLSQ